MEFSSECFAETLLCYIFAFCYYHLLFCCKIYKLHFWKWWKFNKRLASNKRPLSRFKNLISDQGGYYNRINTVLSNKRFSSNRRLSYAHSIMGSPGGKHCKSLQRNVWRGVVFPLKKAVSFDRECRILPWFYEKRRRLMLVRWNCKFLWDWPSVQWRGSRIGFFGPVQSRPKISYHPVMPMVIFGIPPPARSFKSRFQRPICVKILNLELYIREIPVPEKPIWGPYCSR